MMYLIDQTCPNLPLWVSKGLLIWQVPSIMVIITFVDWSQLFFTLGAFY